VGCVAVAWLTLALAVPVSKCDLGNGIAGQSVFWESPPRIYIDRDYYPRVWKADTATAKATYVLAHEMGHIRQRTPAEGEADGWARANWCLIANKLRRRQPRMPTCFVLWRLLPASWKEL
jgi:hypothetical protein